VTLPLLGRELPVIADEYVKTDFGTGALKITPGHDPNDFEIGQRHGLEAISVIGEDGRMTAEAGEFAGLSAMEARAAVVEALGDRIRATEPYTHNVPYSQRSGERIEPLISLQWFMRMEQLAEPAMQVVRDGRVRIHPESQSRRYSTGWRTSGRGACRAAVVGPPDPRLVPRRGEVYCGIEPPRGRMGARSRRPRHLVLERAVAVRDARLARGHPGAARLPSDRRPVDARDILVPVGRADGDARPRVHRRRAVRDVYIHSVIQAPDGGGCPKSLGTGIDPRRPHRGRARPPVFKEGGDFPPTAPTPCASAAGDVLDAGRQVQRGARRAGRGADQQALQRVAVRAAQRRRGRRAEPRPTTVEDRWILSRLQRAKADAAARIEAFDFSKLAFGLYDFVFGELCDWYLELVKARLYDGDADAQATLLHVLRETLALAHPVIPFVTEELWSEIDDTMLAAGRTPDVDEALIDAAAEEQVQRAIDAIRALRGWRESLAVKPGLQVAGVLHARATARRPTWSPAWRGFSFSANGDEPPPPCRSPAAPSACCPARALDLGAAERKREAERERLDQEIARAEGKLGNERLRRQGPGRGRRRERSKLERLRAERDACERRGRHQRRACRASGCSTASCSACASAWTGCAGCSPRSARRRSSSARSTSSARTASPRRCG
jgi:valyl-tRNA synthetase